MSYFRAAPAARRPSAAAIIRARQNRSGFRFHVRVLQGLLFQRSRDRSRHGEHADLCPRQRHRAERAFRGRDPAGRRTERQAGDPGSRPRREADARPHARQHHGDPADEGRRHRRLHRDRADAEAVHQEGARVAAVFAFAADHHLRALRLDAGRAPRDPRVGARRRRVEGVPDRGADGRGDRRRSADLGCDRIDGRRHRRRHDGSRRHLAGRHGVFGQRARRRRQVRRGDRQLHPPQLRHADRRDDGGAHQEDDRLRRFRAPK